MDKPTAATLVQAALRGYCTRKRLKDEKEDNKRAELLEKLEREAYAQMVRFHQMQYDRELKKEAARREKQRIANRRRRRMLEASYDGENHEIMAILREVTRDDDAAGIGHDAVGKALRQKHLIEMVECTDANGNTPISEAASGGNPSTIILLIENGADPNSRGQFMRTPLYRAAFAGHMEAIHVLLGHGADPRLYAADGQTPENVASLESIICALRHWDTKLTDQLSARYDLEKRRRQDVEQTGWKAELNAIQEKISRCEKEFNVCQAQVKHCFCELNKREEELVGVEASNRTDLIKAARQAVDDANLDLEISRGRLDKAEQKLSLLRMEAREKKQEKEPEQNQPGIYISLRELDDVLMKDPGGRIRDSKKWPLIIDSSGRSGTYLQYRDTNYMMALNPVQMAADKIRMALLGALRYGKPFVLDMMDVDMLEACTRRFDEIQTGLMQSILSKDILAEQKYLSLVRDGDGPDYDKTQFSEVRMENFMFIVVIKNKFPSKQLLEAMYPIWVQVGDTKR